MHLALLQSLSFGSSLLTMSRSLSLGASSCWCWTYPLGHRDECPFFFLAVHVSSPGNILSASRKCHYLRGLRMWFPFISLSQTSPCISSHLSRSLVRVRQEPNPVLQAWHDQRGGNGLSHAWICCPRPRRVSRRPCHAVAGMKVCMCTCVMNKGKVMGVNCVFRGGSTHSLCGMYSGSGPCQAEAGTRDGNYTQTLEDAVLSARSYGLRSLRGM